MKNTEEIVTKTDCSNYNDMPYTTWIDAYDKVRFIKSLADAGRRADY